MQESLVFPAQPHAGESPTRANSCSTPAPPLPSLKLKAHRSTKVIHGQFCLAGLLNNLLLYLGPSAKERDRTKRCDQRVQLREGVWKAWTESSPTMELLRLQSQMPGLRPQVNLW